MSTENWYKFHVYFVHPLTNISVNISTKTWPKCLSTYRAILGWCNFVKTKICWSTYWSIYQLCQSTYPTNTRPICWSICRPRVVFRLLADMSINRLLTFCWYWTGDLLMTYLSFDLLILHDSRLIFHQQSVVNVSAKCRLLHVYWPRYLPTGGWHIDQHSADFLVVTSVDMLTDISWSIYRPIVSWHVDWHIGRVSVLMSADISVECR